MLKKQSNTAIVFQTHEKHILVQCKVLLHQLVKPMKRYVLFHKVIDFNFSLCGLEIPWMKFYAMPICDRTVFILGTSLAHLAEL